ncbi:MAG: TolC family protein [Candidatus Riflebacteria bacterium]|nr:TolC family protein [Candidatus Riflebacteria bacterium]
MIRSLIPFVKVVLIVAVVITTSAMNTQPANASEPETTSDLLRRLSRDNPRIIAARESVAAAAGRIAVERAWADPMIGFMVMPNPTEEMAMLLGARNINVSQQVPLAGQKRLAGRIADTKRLMEEARARLILIEQTEALLVALSELRYLDEAINIVRQNRQILDQISGVAITRTTSPTLLWEIQRVQTQLAQAGYDESLLRELRISEQARINGLLNRPPETPFQLAIASDSLFTAPPASLSVLLEQMRCMNPALTMSRETSKMASQEIVMARKENSSELTIGFTQPGDRNWKPDTRGRTYSVELSLPVWDAKNSGRFRAATHSAKAAKADEQSEENRIATELTGQYVRVHNAWRTIRIYEDTLLPQAEKALEGAQADPKRSDDTFPQLLEAQAVLLNFQLAYRRAQSDYAQALARMYSLTGVLPEIAETIKP